MPRKQPFSGKQKKQQLKEKRGKKQDAPNTFEDDRSLVMKRGDGAAGSDSKHSKVEVTRINEQPVAGKDWNPNRYRLHFFKIPSEEMKRRKEEARKPVVKVTEKELEISMESVHGYDSKLDFPKRPTWNYKLTKEQLERQEQTYFQEYLEKIFSTHKVEDLSYFELNLETWRQLWRVTEISDILLLIADIRYPVIHLPPSLYRYLRKELNREVILVLNKVDMSPPSLVAAWYAYLSGVFPEAHIVCFTSYPKEPQESEKGLLKKQKLVKKIKRPKPIGPQELFDICNKLVGDKVDLSSWQHKLNAEDTSTSAPERHEDEDEDENSEEDDTHPLHSTEASDSMGFSPDLYQRFKDGILTIGCIGYPNVGKSSLLNGLVGKKVVSVSRTPGHTKHLQTIFLTPTVRLCDCPGLVFPSTVDRSLQIFSGIYPIAQVSEPYSIVSYIAQRMDLPGLLRIPHPEDEGPAHCKHPKDRPWSAFDICEGWAIKNGFRTAKAARPDVYRAANHLLRMSVEGRLRLCLAPPDYFSQQEKWKNDPFALALTERLEKKKSTGYVQGLREDESSDSFSETDEEGKKKPSVDNNESDVESADEGELEEISGCSRNPFALLADN